MKLLIGLFYTIVFISNSFSQSAVIGDKWDALDDKIINSTIDEDEAIELMYSYEPLLKKYFYKNNGITVARQNWVFPLKNFTSIYYREKGNDYREDKYDYFQGSNTKGHPAHDIMILDSNKDLFDDITLSPVDVVSMSSGVVVATDSTWEPGSLLRGGKYVKIFDVNNNGLFYYSHLSNVNVRPGDIVNAGDKIGEVGRTGRKAIAPSGKTHLHVAFLRFEEGYPIPEDIIDDLRRSEKNLIKK
ncbi:MAG: M23 family metallopeptidase [Ignavibacteria bacterium]